MKIDRQCFLALDSANPDNSRGISINLTWEKSMVNINVGQNMYNSVKNPDSLTPDTIAYASSMMTAFYAKRPSYANVPYDPDNPSRFTVIGHYMTHLLIKEFIVLHDSLYGDIFIMPSMEHLGNTLPNGTDLGNINITNWYNVNNSIGGFTNRRNTSTKGETFIASVKPIVGISVHAMNLYPLGFKSPIENVGHMKNNAVFYFETRDNVAIDTISLGSPSMLLDSNDITEIKTDVILNDKIIPISFKTTELTDILLVSP